MKLRTLWLSLSVVALLTVGGTAVAAEERPEPKLVEASTGGSEAADVIPGVETHDFGNTYVLLDSTDAGGPTFNSPVYNTTTVLATVSAADDNFEMVPLGFSFGFYGVDHANVFVTSNGALTFTAGDTSFTNVDLATEDFFPVPTIYAFVDDLAPFNGGDVTYDLFGAAGDRVFVVTYEDIPTLATATSPGTFQVRLFEADDSIEVHYFDTTFGNTHDFGGSATLGVRGGDAGSPYLQYSLLTPQIESGLALRYWVPRCGGELATIVGDRGDDPTLTGTAGVDVIHGHHGDDVITGLGDDDFLCGGAGEDLLSGDDGRDRLFGGDGDDELNGGFDVDRLKGGDGADVLRGEGGSDRMWGEDGDDTMEGGSGADRMWGGMGNDDMTGGGGQDQAWGDEGADIIQGNHQSDIIHGGTGHDTLRGAAGKDKIYGEAGNDEMFGGDNTDYLHGGVGTDIANGQKGKDNPLVTDVSGCVAETKISC